MLYGAALYGSGTYGSNIPVVVTLAPTVTSSPLATLRGLIADSGGSEIITRGFQYMSTNGGEGYPAIVFSEDLTDTFTYSATILHGARYRVRAFAQNEDGTGYGEWVSYGFSDDKEGVMPSKRRPSGDRRDSRPAAHRLRF